MKCGDALHGEATSVVRESVSGKVFGICSVDLRRTHRIGKRKREKESHHYSGRDRSVVGYPTLLVDSQVGPRGGYEAIRYDTS